MSTVLSVYTKDAFKEYLLPSLNNADYVITLYSGYFHLQEDVQLKLEVLDHTWRIQSDTHYQVTKDDGSHKGEYRGQPLKNNDILRVQTNYMEDMSIIVRDMASSFHVYTKFQLEDVGEITIGKRQENDIVYHQLGMVSGTHAKIEKTHRGYRILNSSPNGIYVNSMRVDKSMDLMLMCGKVARQKFERQPPSIPFLLYLLSVCNSAIWQIPFLHYPDNQFQSNVAAPL